MKMNTDIVSTFIKNAFDNDKTMKKNLRNLCNQNQLPATENFEYEIKEKDGSLIGKIRGTLSIDNDLLLSLKSNNSLRKQEFDVFISYCWGKKNKNKERVLNVYNELVKKGLKCWLDQKYLTGNELFDEISEGILKSKLFMCCLDSEYCKSNSTISEFYFANFNKKPIKTVLFEPLEEIIKNVENNPIAIHIPSKHYEKFYPEDKKKPIDDKLYIKNLLKSIDPLLKHNKSIPYTNFSNLNTNKGRAIQLIKIENDEIQINSEAKNIILSISGPIGVISVVGASRSGKSYLMNRLLHLTDGFKSHSNIDACTKGIWFWSGIELHRNDKNEEMNLIIMDTEGLNHVNSSPLLTSKIFLLSILISSQIIYNTKEIIDEDSLSKLAKMCNLSKIQISENETSNWPTFIWVLRDFKLTHNFKNDNEYLESVLKEKQSDNSDQQNNKNTIAKWFVPGKRHCIALPEPVSDGHGFTLEEKLAKLSDLDASYLRPKFNILVNDLIKLSRGIVTAHPNFDCGRTLIDYIDYAVSLLNTERLINLESLQNSIIENQKNFYIATIEESINEKFESRPIDPKELEEYVQFVCEKQQKKLETFAKIDFKNVNESIKSKFISENNKLIETMNEDLIFNNWKNIKHRLPSDENRIDTIEKFHQELDNIKSAYYAVAYGTQEQKDKSLQDFYINIDKTSIEDSIKNTSITSSVLFELNKYKFLEREVLINRMKMLGLPKLYTILHTYSVVFPRADKLESIKKDLQQHYFLKEIKVSSEYRKLLSELIHERLPENLEKCKTNLEFNEVLKEKNYHVVKLGII